MPIESLIDIIQQMLFVIIGIVAVISLPGLLVGLCVAVFQAATQINESTLSFLPKLFAILFTIALLSPWFINLLIEFTESLFIDIPNLIG